MNERFEFIAPSLGKRDLDFKLSMLIIEIIKSFMIVLMKTHENKMIKRIPQLQEKSNFIQDGDTFLGFF